MSVLPLYLMITRKPCRRKLMSETVLLTLRLHLMHGGQRLLQNYAFISNVITKLLSITLFWYVVLVTKVGRLVPLGKHGDYSNDHWSYMLQNFRLLRLTWLSTARIMKRKIWRKKNYTYFKGNYCEMFSLTLHNSGWVGRSIDIALHWRRATAVDGLRYSIMSLKGDIARAHSSSCYTTTYILVFHQEGNHCRVG